MGNEGFHMEIEMEVEMELKERVMEMVMKCNGGERKREEESPLIWAIEIGKCIGSRGLDLPSPELGFVLVSLLSSSGFSSPPLWKFLHQSISYNLVSSLHVLSLLAPRVLLHRKHQPEAYRLFLELISRCTLSFEAIKTQSSKEKIVNSVDATLQLSCRYGIHMMELGHALVLFLYNIVVSLMDCTLDDWGLQVPSDSTSVISVSKGIQGMDIDFKDNPNGRRSEHHEQMRTRNSLLSLEVLTKLTDSRQAIALLHLVHLNMPKIFDGLLQRLQFLEAHTKLPSVDSNHAKQALARLSTNLQKVSSSRCHISRRRFIGMPVDSRSYNSMPHCSSDASLSVSWVSFDIYMEIAMDAKELPVTSSIDILAESIITLKVLNGASWEETFLALWLSALRLVQRDRDPPEGPIPHLEPRLCVLLCIVPLAIAKVLKDDDNMHFTITKGTFNGHGMDEKNLGSPINGLISSLQILGQFSGLLCPPQLVVNAANSAAAKAASFVSSTCNSMGGGFQGNSLMEAGGNMRHLIVEACIARSLIDTSVYFWPDYVPTSIMSSSDSSPKQISPWNVFMEGAALSGSLINSLIMTPATSVTEVEKVYYIALNGTEQEKSAAGKILCGASLTCGWNIQEHVVNFVLKLLSSPVSYGDDGMQALLLRHRSMLSAVLFGASSIDTVHILTLHGVVPEIAASLMPLCEAFGSVNPASTDFLNGDEPSIYMVFSAAFLFLLRLWKFYRPPFEQCLSGATFIGPELSLEYLLLLYNSRISPASDTYAAHFESSSDKKVNSASKKAMYIEYYPKLKTWYCQNKICISSTLSGVCSGHPVHQVANKVLSMMYSKMNKSTTSSGNSSTPSSSSLCGSPQSAAEEAYQKPMLPAWEILESIPFVLEAILTACAHGRLSSRDLTTGLRDLVDFLPASLAAIISYFSAEISRGIWKPVPMNGIDWPSPAFMLQTVESEIKEILAGAGVHIPSCSSALTPMLPLPMAALVSLTITFKLDKTGEYIQAVAGPALENCACSCPWPSMTTVGSLWAQKVRRWHDFIVFSTSRSVFRQNKEAVAQLLRSCFTSFLGPLYGSKSLLVKQNSVHGLLGSTISALGVRPSIAPGFLYLRSCRTIQNIQYLNGVILGLVAEHSSEAGSTSAKTSSVCLKSSRVSLSVATARLKEVAALGASLLCAAGGLQLVQELYQETVPTWLLSAREDKLGEVSAGSRVSQGSAIAYLVFISGAFVWGVRAKPASWAASLRPRIVGIHMKFLAGVLHGNTSVGCHPATWKAYVSCLIGLIVNFAPAWVQEVKQDILMKLVSGLRGLHECELALALLESGGIAAMGHLAELLTKIY